MVEETPEVTMTDVQEEERQAAAAEEFKAGEAAEEEVKMQVDETPATAIPTAEMEETKEASVVVRKGRIIMFPRLDSKMCIATVLSFLLKWEQCVPFFSCLSKVGLAYFEQHKPQFRYFIEDRPVAPLEM